MLRSRRHCRFPRSLLLLLLLQRPPLLRGGRAYPHPSLPGGWPRIRSGLRKTPSPLPWRGSTIRLPLPHFLFEPPPLLTLDLRSEVDWTRAAWSKISILLEEDAEGWIPQTTSTGMLLLLLTLVMMLDLLLRSRERASLLRRIRSCFLLLPPKAGPHLLPRVVPLPLRRSRRRRLRFGRRIRQRGRRLLRKARRWHIQDRRGRSFTPDLHRLRGAFDRRRNSLRHPRLRRGLLLRRRRLPALRLQAGDHPYELRPLAQGLQRLQSPRTEIRKHRYAAEDFLRERIDDIL